MAPIKRHEGRHTVQWAAFTILGGPLAFPIIYALDESVAPGAYNHFERQAGLADGGYTIPDGPSPAIGRLTFAAAVLAFVAFERRRVHRHAVLLAALVGVDRRTRRGARRTRQHRRLRHLGCPACGRL